MAEQNETAKADAQRQRPPETVETAAQARQREQQTDTSTDPVTTGKTKGDLGTAREAVRERRAREFRRVAIEPGAAGDPVEPDEGAYDEGVLTGKDEKVTLDDNVSMPSTAVPGSGPFDTVDPLEHASSVLADKATAARAGLGTVNAVVPIPDPSGIERAEVLRMAEREGGDRIEKYPVRRDNGTYVMVERNVDTGASKVLGPVG